MSNGPQFTQHIARRARYFRAHSPEHLKAFEELTEYLQKTTDNLESKREQITAESNEYERQYTSFFALAISIIVAGLLSSPPNSDATNAARIFYFASFFTASVAAIFLFLEYRVVGKLFDKWDASIAEALHYISNGSWHDPAELNHWIAVQQSQVPKKSTKAVQRIELTLVSSAFFLLGMWLYETLFNPNWPIF